MCLSISIVIDSVNNMTQNYYPQLLLEECKYKVKERKMTRYITEYMEIYSDDVDDESEEDSGKDSEQFVKIV